MTLTPSYGRDYKSGKEVKAAWEADKDFTIADLFGGDCGRQINKSAALKAGLKEVMIRFKRLTGVCVVKVK